MAESSVVTGPYHKVEKLWGEEHWWFNNELYCMKTLIVNPRSASSFHYHKLKDEGWLIEEGNLVVFLGTGAFWMSVGETVRIAPGVRHRFMNFSKNRAVIREVSTPHIDSDTYRILPSKQIKEGESYESNVNQSA